MPPTVEKKLQPARGLWRLVPEAIRARAIEALGGSLLGYNRVPSGDDDSGWRPITERVRTRDLDIISHRDAIRVSLYLYTSNNLARWLVDMPVSLCLGQELAYSIEVDAEKAPADYQQIVEKMREALDRFWYHPSHNISDRAEQYAKTFLVTGHLVLPVFAVNEVDVVPQFDIV